MVRLTLVLALAFPTMAQTQRSAEEMRTEEVIEKLRNNPGEVQFVYLLAKRPSDWRVIPALRELFDQARSTGVTNILGFPASRDIVIALFTLGVKDDVYFDEVAKYAREAIAADPPLAFLKDADGNDTKQLTPAFQEWCAHRGLDLDGCPTRALRYGF